MNILVTVGPDLLEAILYIICYKAYKIINFDALTYSGNLNNVKVYSRSSELLFCKRKFKMESCWRCY